MAIIYKDSEYKGKSRSLSLGFYSELPDGWNDEISSLRVGTDETIAYYQDVNFGGDFSYVDSNKSYIGGDWNDKVSSIIVLNRARVKTWMSYLPDDRSLANMTIPGTHDSTTDNLIPQAECQGYSFAKQLEFGVRFFDIRCREESALRSSSYLNCYHGPVPCNVSFHKVMQTFVNFLKANPRETIIMSLKNEGDDVADFARCFKNEYFANSSYKDFFWTGTGIPKLGDVRGKIVLFRRFKDGPNVGIDASSGWKDNATFTTGNARVQDQYKVTDPRKKKDIVWDFVNEAHKSDKSKLYVNFLSSAYTDLTSLDTYTKTPYTIAFVVNQKMRLNGKANHGKDLSLGCLLMDYAEPGIVAAYANLNAGVNCLG